MMMPGGGGGSGSGNGALRRNQHPGAPRGWMSGHVPISPAGRDYTAGVTTGGGGIGIVGSWHQRFRSPEALLHAVGSAVVNTAKSTVRRTAAGMAASHLLSSSRNNRSLAATAAGGGESSSGFASDTAGFSRTVSGAPPPPQPPQPQRDVASRDGTGGGSNGGAADRRRGGGAAAVPAINNLPCCDTLSDLVLGQWCVEDAQEGRREAAPPSPTTQPAAATAATAATEAAASPLTIAKTPAPQTTTTGALSCSATGAAAWTAQRGTSTTLLASEALLDCSADERTFKGLLVTREGSGRALGGYQAAVTAAAAAAAGEPTLAAPEPAALLFDTAPGGASEQAATQGACPASPCSAASASCSYSHSKQLTPITLETPDPSLSSPASAAALTRVDAHPQHRHHHHTRSKAQAQAQAQARPRSATATGALGANSAPPPAPAILAFRGLRVRMGLESGVASAAIVRNAASGRLRYGGPALRLARAIGDSGQGGMVLLGESTMSALQAMGAGALTRALKGHSFWTLWMGVYALPDDLGNACIYQLISNSLIGRLALQLLQSPQQQQLMPAVVAPPPQALPPQAPPPSPSQHTAPQALLPELQSRRFTAPATIPLPPSPLGQQHAHPAAPWQPPRLPSPVQARTCAALASTSAYGPSSPPGACVWEITHSGTGRSPALTVTALGGEDGACAPPRPPPAPSLQPPVLLRKAALQRPLWGVLPAPVAGCASMARLAVVGARTLMAWDAGTTQRSLALLQRTMLEELALIACSSEAIAGRVYVSAGGWSDFTGDGVGGGGGGGKGAAAAAAGWAQQQQPRKEPTERSSGQSRATDAAGRSAATTSSSGPLAWTLAVLGGGGEGGGAAAGKVPPVQLSSPLQHQRGQSGSPTEFVEEEVESFNPAAGAQPVAVGTDPVGAAAAVTAVAAPSAPALAKMGSAATTLGALGATAASGGVGAGSTIHHHPPPADIGRPQPWQAQQQPPAVRHHHQHHQQQQQQLGVMTVVMHGPPELAARWLLTCMSKMPSLDWPVELLEHPLAEPAVFRGTAPSESSGHSAFAGHAAGSATQQPHGGRLLTGEEGAATGGTSSAAAEADNDAASEASAAGGELRFRGLRAAGVLVWGDLGGVLPVNSLTGHVTYKGRAAVLLKKAAAVARAGQVVTDAGTASLLPRELRARLVVAQRAH
ncbi:hypothetical protein HYH02_009342 [Chlamydomonas schloesseri]|uniref:Guanylate cyclase domain-containing protein n=1 Tax=Chlamydomonas schloesseri TaxID=2026947 RepID=A0A835TM99_9CHLO|nr:hypothetical protein HYH02_009342 [Chlamydomonas schloesseri]|eukprot:KAG2443269.1 hypothetical protein HYH02_009342 [Chlamydomonas schloesseri]